MSGAGGFPIPPGLPASLPGAVTATRYVGGTAAGAPVSGTFLAGDFTVNADASIFVCTVAGTPGTWIDTATVGPSVSSVFGRTGAVSAAGNDYTFAQISTAANAIAVSKLAGVLAGQFIGGVTPAGSYPPGYEIDYVEVTAPVTVTAGGIGTQTTVVTSSNITYDGTPIYIEFFVPEASTGASLAGGIVIELYDGASDLGVLCQVISAAAAASGTMLYGVRKYTPSAAAHIFTAKAWVSGGGLAGTLNPGAGGGSGIYVPGFIRTRKA